MRPKVSRCQSTMIMLRDSSHLNKTNWPTINNLMMFVAILKRNAVRMPTMSPCNAELPTSIASSILCCLGCHHKFFLTHWTRNVNQSNVQNFTTHLPFDRPEKERLKAPCQPICSLSELKSQVLSRTGFTAPFSM